MSDTTTPPTDRSAASRPLPKPGILDIHAYAPGKSKAEGIAEPIKLPATENVLGSSPAAQEKYYPLLEKTRTHNELYYVGPREKEQFVAYLNHRLRDKRLESLVKNLFRPSYGGNRNVTLMYTLGGLMVSSDDDIWPFTLMQEKP